MSEEACDELTLEDCPHETMRNIAAVIVNILVLGLMTLL
jgi:hypothetical protein